MNPTDIENYLRVVLVDWGIIIMAAWFVGRLGKRFGQLFGARQDFRVSNVR